jgi:hypothetical protein
MTEPRKTPSRVFRVEITDEENAAEAVRIARFQSWLDECAALQDTIVESLLTNLPSLEGDS